MTVRPAKTQISLGIHPVWSEPSLCIQWVAKDPRFLHADSEDSDQTGQMPRLIWVFAGRTATLLGLSWGSLFMAFTVKVKKALDSQNTCCNHPKIWTVWFVYKRCRGNAVKTQEQSDLDLQARILTWCRGCDGTLLAEQIISKSCSFSPETEFTPLTLDSKLGFCINSHPTV